MNSFGQALAAVFITGTFVCLEVQGQSASPVRYTLMEGSYFVDDCLICGRPTIEQPLRGTFDLVLKQDTAPYTRYVVENIDFVAGPKGSGFERQISGEGDYVRFEEFALLQDMNLATVVKDSYTNHPAYITNSTRTVQRPFPLIQISLRQTNGTMLQTFSMEIFAAPVREIWFSTASSFKGTNSGPAGDSSLVSSGDLLSNQGRVVKYNQELTRHLGVMPIVSDLGLDALDIQKRGEILISIPVDVFSETLGPLHHGDLLSNQGAIVKRNQELLAAFHPASTNDAGLDGVRILQNGEILFSIQSNVVSTSNGTLSRGDILSDSGHVYMTHQQLLANFQPAVTNHDFGLDAFHIFPTGEIWFSVEEGFNDNSFGPIGSGDILSSYGYRVFSNRDLLETFGPTDPAQDYGLDGLFIITDLAPPRPPPRFTSQISDEDMMHFEWEGEGSVFQLETLPGLNEMWQPCSDITSDLFLDNPRNPAPGATGFFRLRQW